MSGEDKKLENTSTQMSMKQYQKPLRRKKLAKEGFYLWEKTLHTCSFLPLELCPIIMQYSWTPSIASQKMKFSEGEIQVKCRYRLVSLQDSRGKQRQLTDSISAKIIQSIISCSDDFPEKEDLEIKDHILTCRGCIPDPALTQIMNSQPLLYTRLCSDCHYYYPRAGSSWCTKCFHPHVRSWETSVRPDLIHLMKNARHHERHREIDSSFSGKIMILEDSHKPLNLEYSFHMIYCRFSYL
jgi:hypothetical protein